MDENNPIENKDADFFKDMGGEATQAPAGGDKPTDGEQGNADSSFELNQDAQPSGGDGKQAFDFDAEFQKRFPGKTLTEVTEELSGIETLKKKAEAKSYRSPLGESFDELVAPVEHGGKGIPPEVAVQYLSDTSKMSERQYKALVMKIEHPEFSDQDIQELIDADYKLGKYAGIAEGDDEATVNEKEKLGRLQLKRDVSELRKKEAETKKKMLEPYESRGKIQADENRQKAEQSETKRKEEWKQVSKKMIDEFKEFKIPVGSKEVGENGSKKTVPIGHFKFAVTDDLRQKIAADVNKIIENNSSLMPDEKGQQFVREKLFRLTLLDHALDKIAHSLVNFGKSEDVEVWRKELDNPSLGGTAKHDGTTTQPNNPYDWIFKNVKVSA